MPDNSKAKQRAEALIALGLSNEASDTPQAADCPDEAEIAEFVDGQHSIEEKASFKQRLLRCPESYPQWLNLAKLHSSQKKQAKAADFGIFERLSQWLTMPSFAIPTGMASAAVVVMMVVLLVPKGEDYAEFDSLLAQQYSGIAGISGLPWQEETRPFSFKSLKPLVGFSDQQAFAAGMKQALLALKPDDKTQQVIEQSMPSLPVCESDKPACKNQLETLKRAGEWAVLTNHNCAKTQVVDWTPEIRLLLSIITKNVGDQAKQYGREHTSLEHRLIELYKSQEAGAAPEQLCKQLGAVIGFVVN